MTTSLDRWSIQQSEIGGLPFLEMREGSTIFRYLPPGSQVDVSIDGGGTYRNSISVARSMFQAEAFGRAVALEWRAENAQRRARKPYKATLAATLGRARARAGAARAARGEIGGHGRSLRAAADPPPPGLEFDRPEAIEFARMELSSYRASLSGQGGQGWKDLFSAAVALVRGYALLPDGAASTLLEEYNESSDPPWPSRDLRRALVLAESIGKMPWGVLFFRDLALAARKRGGGSGEGST